MANIPHPIAILKLSRQVKQVIAFATSVVTAMTDNASFPSPTPPIATLTSDVDALAAAEAQVLSRTKGAAEARDVKLAALRSDLAHMMAYVQQVANANPSTAAAIIQSAGMSVRQAAVRTKGDLEAKPGSVSGTVRLIAKAAAHRASYDWQYSTDQKTWTTVPSTLQAKTEIVGLTPATAYFFHFRSVTKAGEGNWSQVVSLLVS
jgi:hypothetical protein